MNQSIEDEQSTVLRAKIRTRASLFRIRDFVLKIRMLPLVFLLFFSPVAQATYADYSFNEPGPFFNYDIYIKWDHDVPSTTGIYPAFTFAFQTGRGGYMGMQSDDKGKHAIFSIWDDEDGSMSAMGANPNCDRFGGEGVGARCLIDYPWVAGRDYRLRIWELGTGNDTELWGSWIMDTVTQVETLIGVISLRNINGYQGYGWLKNTAGVFLERYVSDPSGTCSSQPDAKVTWRGPYANNNGAMASKAVISYAHYPTSCPNTNVWSTGAPFISAEDGGATIRTTPEYTDVWALIPQSILFGTAPSVVVGGTGTLSAVGGGSGNAVEFASLNTNICTVSGATVTGVSAGVCPVLAFQAGNANYSPASPVTQNIPVSLVETAPSAPSLISAVAGPGNATIVFAAGSTGGVATNYTVTCTAPGRVPRAATGVASPITVSGMTAGIKYSCSVVASNSFGSSESSLTIVVTPIPRATLIPILMLLLG